MKSLTRIICLLLCLALAFSFTITAFAEENQEVVNSFNNPNGRVLSVANLGNTRKYPENSLEGINSCVDLGVDAVTVTVQLTKDNKLVLLSNNDLSINCATKGDGTAVMGKASDYSLEDLQSKFVLRAGHGGETSATGCGLTSLEEVITATNGKIIIIVTNGNSYEKEISTLAKELKATDFIVLAGYESSSLSKSSLPVLANYTDGQSSGSAKDAIENSINGGAKVLKLNVLKESTLKNADGKIRLLIDMSNEESCGDLQDRIAGWEEAIELGYSMIITDYPENLANYLKQIEGTRTTLSSLIGEVEGMNTSKYTKASVNALEDALETAKEVTADGSLSLDKADEAYYNLQEAIDGLTISTGDESVMLPTWLVIIIVIAAVIITIALVVLALRFFNKFKRSQKKLEKFKEKFNSDVPVVNDETLTTNIAEDEESNMGIEEEEIIDADLDEETESEIDEEPKEEIIEVGETEPAEEAEIKEDTKFQIVDVIGNVDIEKTETIETNEEVEE